MRSPSVGVVHWGVRDELAEAVTECFGALGHPVSRISPTMAGRGEVDVLFTMGPFGPITPWFSQGSLSSPQLVVWHTEQFWDPRFPIGIGRWLSRMRSTWERRAMSSGLRLSFIQPLMELLKDKGHRFRYFGDLMWLQQIGALHALATPSAWTTRFLCARGLPAQHINLGSHPIWGADLRLERDIPVLWLGKPGSRRRARLLDEIEAALARRGVKMLRVDGIHHPYVFGPERVELFNRARLVLNILRQPHDSNLLRLYLAAPNRAMMISEPLLPHAPFVQNRHIVYAPVAELADTALHFLTYEQERRAIAEEAHQLVTTELTLMHAVENFIALLAGGWRGEGRAVSRKGKTP
jgi:hypothetical protein